MIKQPDKTQYEMSIIDPKEGQRVRLSGDNCVSSRCPFLCGNDLEDTSHIEPEYLEALGEIQHGMTTQEIHYLYCYQKTLADRLMDLWVQRRDSMDRIEF